MPNDASPPTAANILRMAKAYLARRAASRQQLRVVLRRKARRRFPAHPLADDTPDVERLIDDVLERLVRGGLLDDESLAVSRAAGFAAQGLPASRVRDKLKQQGFDVTHEAIDERIEHDDEAQARRFAERKRLGPYGSGRREVSLDRDVRALVRAGFSPRLAFRLMAELLQTDGDSHAIAPESDSE